MEIGWKIIAGPIPVALLTWATSSIKMSVKMVIREAEFLYMAAQYVSLYSFSYEEREYVKKRGTHLNPLGFELLTSFTKSDKLAILMVDAIEGTSNNSWKIGGFTTGFPYSYSPTMSHSSSGWSKAYAKIICPKGSEGPLILKVSKAWLSARDVLEV